MRRSAAILHPHSQAVHDTLDPDNLSRARHLFRRIAMAGEVGDRALAGRYSIHAVWKNRFSALCIDDIAVDTDFSGWALVVNRLYRSVSHSLKGVA
jgi:hypothetical protein